MEYGYLLLFLIIPAVILLAERLGLTQQSPDIGETGRTYVHIEQETAKKMMEKNDGHVIVDVRREDEYLAGHIPGAILIPNESIGTKMPEQLPDLDQVILVYCRSGVRSKEAATKLAAMGYKKVYEFGGILSWTGDTVVGMDPWGEQTEG